MPIIFGSDKVVEDSPWRSRQQKDTTFPPIPDQALHYDNDGYIIQWARSSIPANTLAALNGLALDCAERQVLSENVEIQVTAWDETNTRIRADRIIRKIRDV